MNEFEAIKLAADETLLRVTGYGHVAVVPDLLTVFAAVVATGDEVRGATAANNATMRQVIGAVREAGVKKSDIRTLQLRVIPLFDQTRHDPYRQIKGYEVRNGVTIRIRDVDAAPAVVGAAFEAGANDVQGPVFGTADPQAGIDEARKAALADAAAKAEACAAGLGLRIGRVLSLTEGSLSDMREQVRHFRHAGGASAPPIEEGELRRTLTVAAAYALVPR